MHNFTWEIRGKTTSGCGILYKQYSKVDIHDHQSANDAAVRDVHLTNQHLHVHQWLVMVIDMENVKLSRHVIAFAKKCVAHNMPRVTSIYVVNSPMWARLVCKAVFCLIGDDDKDMVQLCTGSYATIKDEVEAI